MSTPIRVLVADDDPYVRRSLAEVIEDAPDLSLAAATADGDAALRHVRERGGVDVAVLDIRMPGLDGIALTRRLAAEHPDVRVLILTTFDLDRHVVDALRAGADGFLTKAAAIGDVVAAVRTVHAGEAMLAPTATRAVLDQWVRPEAGASSPFAAVTEREREVTRLVAAGLSNEEIADRLHLSLATVKTYLSRLFTRLDVRDRTQLVILGYESGFLTPGSSTFG